MTLELQTQALIVDVSNKLDAALYRINNIAENLEAVKAVAREDLELNSGFKYCELIQAPDPQYFDSDGNFRGPEARQKHYTAFSTGLKKDYFPKCLTFLDLMFGQTPDRISVLFRQATETAKTFLQGRRYASALTLIRTWMPTFASSPTEQESRLDKLFSLSIDETDLNAIPLLVRQIESTQPNYDRFLAKEKYDLLSTTAINKYVDVLLQYYFYPALIKDNTPSTTLLSPLDVERNVHSTKDRESLNSRLALGKAQLQNALRIVNTAIAQYQILTSSMTIIAMDNAMSSYVVPHDLSYTTVNDPLQVRIDFPKKRTDAEIKLRNDNESSLWLLAYDSTLANNWGRFIMLAELHPEIWRQSDPYKSTTWGAVPNSTPLAVTMAQPYNAPWRNLAPEKLATDAFVNHYCAEIYDLPYYPAVPPIPPGHYTSDYFIDYSCFRFNGLFISSNPYGINNQLGIPMPPDYSTKFEFQMPQITDIGLTSVQLTSPQFGPDLLVLMSLKSKILSALDNYSFLEGLSDTQRTTQITLMTVAAQGRQALQ